MAQQKVTVMDFGSDKMEVMDVSDESCREKEHVQKFPLHLDGTYEVFKRLKRLQDQMNFAEAFDGMSEIADRIYNNRYTGITINFIRPLDITRIMDHVGPFVKSLALKLSDKDYCTVDNLVKIQQECEQLTHLSLIQFDRTGYKNAKNFSGTLKSLFLSSCDLANDDNFFDCFPIRKSLTMVGCENISTTAMQRCFERNQRIVSFACTSKTLQYSEFLHLLPNLQRLGIPYDSKILTPNFLAKLQSLRILALDCATENVNDVLLGIVSNEQIELEELELNNVVVDESTFGVLAKFNTLHRLIIINSGPKYRVLPTDKMPPKLVTLVMSRFYFTEEQFNLLLVQHIRDVTFIRNTYDRFDGSLGQWINRRNERNQGKDIITYNTSSIGQTPVSYLFG